MSIKEFEEATYACPANTFLLDSTNPLVKNGKFVVMCPGSAWGAAPTWPVCKQHKCDTVPTKAGLTSLTTGPVYVGGKAAYKCGTAGEIFDFGTTLMRTCKDDGTFDYPNGLTDWPTCSAAQVCSGTVPTPPASSKFKAYVATQVKEFENAVFNCEDNMEIAPGVSSFNVMCKKGGTYDTPFWPTCVPVKCPITPPTDMAFSPQEPKPGQKVTFTCSNTNKVTNLGKSIIRTCQNNGEMSQNVSSLNLVCRDASTCSTSPPTPPANTNLKLVNGVVTREFDRDLVSKVRKVTGRKNSNSSEILT